MEQPEDSLAPEDAARHAAFCQAMLAELGAVRRYAHRLAGDPVDGDDLVQTTYLAAFRWWRTFTMGTEARRWLFTICRRSFVRGRREVAVLALDEPEVEAAAVESLAGVGTGALLRMLEEVDVRPALDIAIGALPFDFRTAVLLVDAEGYTYGEAAAHAGVPVGTIRSRLYRARRLLQLALTAYAQDLGFVAQETQASAGPLDNRMDDHA